MINLITYLEEHIAMVEARKADIKDVERMQIYYEGYIDALRHIKQMEEIAIKLRETL